MGNRIYIIILVLFLGSIMAWASYRLLHTDDDGKVYEVSVILDDASSDRYIACRQGMEQAAQDYNMTLTVLSSDAVARTLEKEVKNDADGFIIEPDGEVALQEYLKEKTDYLNLILFASDIEPEGIYPSITPDNKEVGNLLYQSLVEHYGTASGSLGDVRVAVVVGDGQNPAIQTRYESFMELLNASDALWIEEIHGKNEISGKLISSLESGAYDVVISFDGSTAEQCIDAVNTAQVDGKVGIICEGYSEQVIYYLDKGVVTEVVLPNEFTMGYAGVDALYQKLTTGSYPAKIPEIKLYRVTKDNLYDPEIEKIVFPLAQ